ncbi:MAG TPA: prolyl aminopeptidase [Jatrophihabitans sp.]|nr:prolyl aminopeptidase [Jatrophihabitans sp.]
MRDHYPEIEPYDHGLLDVGDGNLVYWETCGNPDGKPVLSVHGGPGSGCNANSRRYFDPERYRIVLFDQRNCGRSLPHAADPDTDLSANTTAHLIADLEALREHLGIDRWLLFGGSWGSTLSLAYAERYPERVSEIVLVAVTNTRREEIDWLYGGVNRYFPEAWDRFRAFVGGSPSASGTELVVAYNELLQGPDLARREEAAREWCLWEEAIVAGDAGHKPSHAYDSDPRKWLAFARICAHYFAAAAWLEDGELLARASRLHGIPAVLVHGRADLGGSPRLAWELAQAWPDADLHLIEGAGHGSGPGLGETLMAALDGFADRR